MLTRSHRVLLGLLALLAMLGAACAGSDSAGEEAGDAAAETEIAETETAAETATEAAAESDETAAEADDAADDESAMGDARVVSLSPTHTEIMFAIGAGEQLVAVDEYSNYPEAALELPNDLSGFEPNVEAIAAYEPTLVLIGGDFSGLGAQLDELGIAWWDGPAATSFEDIYAQIEQLGAATGHVGEAAELVGQMQTDIAAAVESAPDATGLSVYHELDPTFYSADSTTFIGSVYGLFGLENIADPEGADAFGYPQLNVEYIVEADPDLIFTTHGADLAAVAERDGWADVAAVTHGNVFAMDADIASRWGPRIVEYISEVSAAVASASAMAE